jgi:hypothetical protein
VQGDENSEDCHTQNENGSQEGEGFPEKGLEGGKIKGFAG